MAKNKKPRAKRMSPAERREQILDSAVDYIMANGLSSCSLENVARQAKISTPLIYKYFPKQNDLLRALVEREYHYLRGRGMDKLPRDISYEDIIRNGNLRSFEYLYDRGPIMRLLRSDRNIAALSHGRDRDERQSMVEFITKRTMNDFGLPEDVATVCAVMTVNAPILSTRALKKFGITSQRAAEIWTTFSLGGNKAVHEEFGQRDVPSKTGSEKAKASVKKTTKTTKRSEPKKVVASVKKPLAKKKK